MHREKSTQTDFNFLFFLLLLKNVNESSFWIVTCILLLHSSFLLILLKTTKYYSVHISLRKNNTPKKGFSYSKRVKGHGIIDK